MSHESRCTANIIIFGLTFIPLMKITRMLLQYLDYWIVCEIHIQEGTLKKKCFIQRCPWSCQFTQKQLINFTNFWWEAPRIKEWRPELPCLRWSWNREKISFYEYDKYSVSILSLFRKVKTKPGGEMGEELCLTYWLHSFQWIACSMSKLLKNVFIFCQQKSKNESSKTGNQKTRRLVKNKWNFC